MPTSPAAANSGLYAYATEFCILVGPNDGSTPTLDNEVSNLYPISLQTTSTGSRDDVLVLGFLTMPRLVDTQFPIGMQRQVELRALDGDGDPTIVLGWGMMARQPQRIDEQSELVTIEARIGDQCFGIRLTSFPIYDPPAAGLNPTWVQHPLVFNPEIDGVIRPNRSFRRDSSGNWYYVIDWESCWTFEARTFQGLPAGDLPSRWTLIECVLALCWWCNPDETFIANPTRDELTGASAFTGSTPPINNLAIPFGCSLPEALDALLLPLEISWCLEHTTDDSDQRVTSLRFFRRGDGPAKYVGMQRPGMYRDTTLTTATSFDASYSVIDLANRIECYGELEKRELTVTLTKAWKQAMDATALKDLAIGQPLFITDPEIGRKYVLNESHEYDGLRLESTGWATLDQYGFTSALSVRRRRFLRCLSNVLDNRAGNGSDGETSNGYLVEWYDSTAAGAVDSTVIDDPGWVRVQWPFSVLGKECGIMFDGSTPPEPLWRLIKAGTPDLAKVRITATIEGDNRVTGIATRQSSSSNGLDMTLVLDVADKFQNSQVNDVGLPYPSIFHDNATEARDDTADVLTYAERVRETEDVLRLDVSIKLEGCLHPEILIGDTIPKLRGRNLSMSLNAANRSPQVVGFVYSFQEQSLELLLESFRRERPHVHEASGSQRHRDTTTGEAQLGKAVPMGKMAPSPEMSLPTDMGRTDKASREKNYLPPGVMHPGALSEDQRDMYDRLKDRDADEQKRKDEDALQHRRGGLGEQYRTKSKHDQLRDGWPGS